MWSGLVCDTHGWEIQLRGSTAPHAHPRERGAQRRDVPSMVGWGFWGVGEEDGRESANVPDTAKLKSWVISIFPSSLGFLSISSETAALV